jgi:hypothetical protein
LDGVDHRGSFVTTLVKDPSSERDL